MKQAAAIKRASQQARNAMQALDAAGVDALVALYEDAAAQVRAAIQARVDATDSVAVHQLQPLLRQIEDIIAGLGQQRDALLREQIEQAATLGVRPYTAQGVAAVGGSQAVLESGAAQRVHQSAVRFVLEFVAADGLALSDRLWRLDQGAKEVLSRAIGNAVVQGWSASKAAADFMYSGKAVPADVAARAAGGKAAALVRAADLLTGKGGQVWKADRVFRTEINRAHGEAFMAGGENTPGFAGWRYLLSPRHPAPDICDLLASQNLHGLGPGVYPTRAQTPWPAHPNTLSFVEMVFQDEVTDADRAGKETELQALARLAPDVRAGALGQTKAEYFDQGLLTRGAIRSPLRAVRARLERTQPLPRLHPDALFNVDQAVFTPDKFFRYALNPEHPRGKDKAIVFASALGYTQENGDQLIAALREVLPRYPAKFTERTVHGDMYIVDTPVTGPGGSAMVRTKWMFEDGSVVPKLVTPYVKQSKKK